MTRLLIEKKIVLAMGNEGKICEFRQMLSDTGIKTISAREFGLKEPTETDNTFTGNARIKALHAAEASEFPAISEASGLEVEALDGKPGIATAKWAATPAGQNYREAMKRVWTSLEKISAPEPRLAKFRSTICVAWPGGWCEFFRGSVGGKLVWPMRGEIGIGYDPIFLPDGFNQTFGEMDPVQKARISPRAQSFEAFRNICLGDKI